MKTVSITERGKKPLKGFYAVKTFRALPSWIPKATRLRMHKMGLTGGPVRESPVHENLIVLNTNNGLHIVLQHIGGVTTYPLEVTTAEIGTGTNAAADGNTSLQTPVVTGISRSTVTIGADFVDTEWFFTDGELPNGTYNEFGLRSGTQLFCRSIISPAHTKATGEDTLFEYTIEADNAI